MMKTFPETVREYMDSYSMIEEGGRVVVGLSGGADSVCLLLVLKKLGFSVEAVHINHMIRGAEADRDEAFVRELCSREEIPLNVYKKDIPKLAGEMHMSEEEAGRYVRYETFYECAGENAKIAVAHNKNDLAETVLFNMIRGSSLQGLAGIRPVSGAVVRPLLMTSRAEIEEYLASIDQTYIVDSTNLETDYSRNKIRHQVIPVLEEMNDGAVDHLASIAMDALVLRDDMDKELGDAVDEGLGDAENREEPDRSSRIDIDRLKRLGKLAQGELVLRAMEKVSGKRKDLTREHVRSVIGLSELETGKRISLPYGMVAERAYGEIRIFDAVREKTEKESGGKDAADESCPGAIQMSSYDYTPDIDLSKKEYTKLIDCDKIKSALCLRTPLPGDYIVINESGGSKKLNRYFTEAKLERSLRDSVPVVADGDEIVWIVGYRLSERYKVSPSTSKVTEI